ncbi:CDGSH iron-sulfur domain-containing protein [Kitasatospora sp. NPDC057500]|uniref:CDGSH iron-sulfur domain-containing protein n=1 Tax=Kitasatospora sp. NPDC057500 TaxID=3346151 RepID=UPI0036C59382
MSGDSDPGSSSRPAVRVTVLAEGPILVEGPVEVTGPDGTVRLCERPVVALCACRRSRHRPFCDTSHRRHGGPAARRSAGTIGQG